MSLEDLHACSAMDSRTWRGRAVMIFAAVFLMASTVMITEGARTLADEEIEMHLNGLNKPAIKSIEVDGVVVDCVDIYKQPAFDHPLLKDHKIITSPSFLPKRKRSAKRRLHRRRILQPAWEKSEGCPKGTIPIRRVQRSDVLRASSLKDVGRRDAAPGRVERAGQTLFLDGPYVGAQGSFTVWGLSVEPDEWSHVAVEVCDGEDRENNNNVLEAGWLVNPTVFGNNYTYIYVYWTADGYKDTGCYNLLCPGFVQTTESLAIGLPFFLNSFYRGSQYAMDVSIHKDPNNSVWWLMLDGWNEVGYWPMSLFKEGSFDVATTIRWVGSVLNTNKGGQHTTTQMGSGHYAEEGWTKAAYMYDIQVMKDFKDGFYEPAPTLMTMFADNALCYDYKYLDDDVYFGGPGRGRLCP